MQRVKFYFHVSGVGKVKKCFPCSVYYSSNPTVPKAQGDFICRLNTINCLAAQGEITTIDNLIQRIQILVKWCFTCKLDDNGFQSIV